jgi:hypothetical protein
MAFSFFFFSELFICFFFTFFLIVYLVERMGTMQNRWNFFKFGILFLFFWLPKIWTVFTGNGRLDKPNTSYGFDA